MRTIGRLFPGLPKLDFGNHVLGYAELGAKLTLEHQASVCSDEFYLPEGEFSAADSAPSVVSVSASSNAIEVIVVQGAELKVRRVAAASVVALVADDHSFRDVARCERVSDAMGFKPRRGAVAVKLPVAAGSETVGPLPAGAVVATGNMRPKASSRAVVHGQHQQHIAIGAVACQ
jgi:hypothetical protein